jgi:hypothetical protein
MHKFPHDTVQTPELESFETAPFWLRLSLAPHLMWTTSIFKLLELSFFFFIHHQIAILVFK